MDRLARCGIGCRRALAVACLGAAAVLGGCGGGGGSTVSIVGSAATGGTGSGGGSIAGGGGGSSVTQSPYLLFANDYIAYAAQTKGAYLHSIQGGDVYAGQGGNFVWGQYSSPQTAMNSTGYYTYQIQAGSSVASTDYAYVAVLAPQDATFDISQSNTLLITMGNTYYPAYNKGQPGGNVTTFTVAINDGVGSTPATDSCSYDQTVPAASTVSGAAPGVRNYALPLSSFTCSSGSMANLLANGITTVAVDVNASKNPGIQPGEFDDVSIGTIGFTNWSASAADIAALAQ